MLELEGNAPGLIDHNTFVGNSSAEMIHNYGMGASDTTGWLDDVIPGSAAMLYIEDNTFTYNATGNPAYFWGTSAVQSYYGARTVFRHNVCNMSQVDQHGTAGMIGARWWELYDNTFNVVANGNQSNYMQIRAGSGVIFNNHKTGASNQGAGLIELLEEDSGYPALYQIGRGKNQVLDPAYVWGNDSSMSVTSGSSNVQINRDFYLSQKPNYSPFTYPYPIDPAGLPNPSGSSGGTDTQPPTPPTNVSAVAVSAFQVNLSWTASTDNTLVSGYKVYRDGSQIATTNSNTYSDTSLSPTTSYTYTIAAYDNAGNTSAQSTPAIATTQPSPVLSAFIPSDRTIDWTSTGLPGGIPSATWSVYATLSPSGGPDDSVAIQNAINAAPTGSVVLLNPGIYKLHRAAKVCQGYSDDYASGVYEAGVCITKSVVLRGSGPNNTILQYSDGANIVSMGRTYLSSSQVHLVPVTSGATKGSTQITLQTIAGIAAGTYLVITQNNPVDTDGNPLVNASGYNGCTYCGHDLPNMAMSQIDRVASVSGSTVTLERPLYFSYTNAPAVYTLSMVEFAGLENLRLQPTASSGTGLVYKNINLESCAYCWVHNVESDMAVDRSHIYLSDVYGSEISNNYVNDGYNHNSGATYALFLEFRNSGNLIQNNIIRKARHSMVMVGGSGNVWGYNYAIDPYMGEYHNSLPENTTHGAHPYMNLWEGNVTPNIELDFAHGSSSHNTLFRNYLNLTSTNPDTGTSMTGALFATNLAYFNNYVNVVGNAIGPYGSNCTANSYEINADVAQSSTIYKLGYYDDGGTASPNPNISAKVGSTLLRGGNWDCKTNSVVWNTNAPSGSLASTYLSQQVLPTSLYLRAKPQWFAATVWPPIDPGAATKVNKIPAQLCYEVGPKIGSAFNPAACYGEATPPSGSQPPPPPTNLVSSVQ